MNVPASVTDILERLEARGHKAYIVGGCVRDMYLGREPKDYDITTSATPDDVKRIFDKVIPTGEKYGTVTVMIESSGYEVTTMRSDGIYKDGRRPEAVSFTNDIREDLSRRDLTINAIARDKNGDTIDPFSGIRDLNERTIRAVGEPHDRFREDALRMMRVIRFAAQLGFQVDMGTFNAISDLAGLVTTVSAERIRDELVKILLSNSPSVGLYGLQLSGLMQMILPELSACWRFDQQNPHHNKDVFAHTVSVIDATPNAVVTRLAALFHDIAKPVTFSVDEKGIGHFYDHQYVGAEMTEGIMRRLKFDNDTTDRVCKLVREHMSRPKKRASVKRLMTRVDVYLMPNLIDLMRADIIGSKAPHDFSEVDNLQQQCVEILAQHEPVSKRDLAVNGSDIMELGIPQGPDVGRVLEALEEAVLDDPALNERNTLLRLANSLK